MPLSQRRSLLVQRLRKRKTREREGLGLVEGVRAVREALCSGADVRFVVYSPRLTSTREGVDLTERLAAAGPPIVEVDDGELEALADTLHPQGVLAVCAEPRLDPGVVGDRRCYLVLDGVQDPGNVGTLVRAALAFGVDAVVALGGTADPWGAKAVRASVGMAFRIPVLTFAIDDLLAKLAEESVAVLVADPGGMDVAALPVPDRWALVMGNEGVGVSDHVRAACRHRVKIPMPGDAESLNVGVAGSVLLYALTRESSSA